jgi:hypothetical protein
MKVDNPSKMLALNTLSREFNWLWGQCSDSVFMVHTHGIVRGVGYMDVVEALLPYRNATKTFLTIFDL